MPLLDQKKGPSLYYELTDFTDTWKNAPILILQHGFGRSSRFWYSWVPYLCRHYRVVCPDLRGLGQSSRDFDLNSGITIEAYIADMKELIDSLGADSVHYCGESLGGIIGMVFAAMYPDRIRTLSLVSAPVSINENTKRTFAYEHGTWANALRAMGSEKWSRAANGSTRFPADADPKLQDWYAREMGKSNVDVLVAISQLASQADIREYLPRIEAPVLGLYPSEGAITDPTQEAALRKGIRNLRIINMPSKFHAIQNIMPATCAKHVLYFAAQHDGVALQE